MPKNNMTVKLISVYWILMICYLVKEIFFKKKDNLKFLSVQLNELKRLQLQQSAVQTSITSEILDTIALQTKQNAIEYDSVDTPREVNVYMNQDMMSDQEVESIQLPANENMANI